MHHSGESRVHRIGERTGVAGGCLKNNRHGAGSEAEMSAQDPHRSKRNGVTVLGNSMYATGGGQDRRETRGKIIVGKI